MSKWEELGFSIEDIKEIIGYIAERILDMKWKILGVLVALLFFVGCSDVDVKPVSSQVDIGFGISRLTVVEDSTTHIVYIDNVIKSGGETAHIYHIYTPYIGEHGNYCTLNDGVIKEIENGSE